MVFNSISAVSGVSKLYFVHWYTVEICPLSIYINLKLMGDKTFIIILSKYPEKSFKIPKDLIYFCIFGVLMPLSAIFQLYHGDQFW
jgi:hypothetical protein